MAQPKTIPAWIACGAASGMTTKWGTDTKYPWAAVAARSTPPKAPTGYALVAEANLRARGIIYYKSNCGDCGAPQKVSLSNADLANLGTKLGTSGLGIGLASTGALVGVAAAGATLGLAAVGTVIATIFANHANAVKQEQSTICQVAGITNQIIPQIDAAVASGKLSPAQGITAMENYCQQLSAQLAGIEKSCDAACVYQSILQAHADFASSFYPGIAPSKTAAPAAPAKPPAQPTPPAAPPATVAQSSGGALTSAPRQVSLPPVAAAPLPIISAPAAPPATPGIATVGSGTLKAPLSSNPWIIPIAIAAGTILVTIFLHKQGVAA